jgi:hypothetical protein
MPWIGRRWFSSLWLIPLAIVGLVLSIAVVREMTRFGRSDVLKDSADAGHQLTRARI